MLYLDNSRIIALLAIAIVLLLVNIIWMLLHDVHFRKRSVEVRYTKDYEIQALERTKGFYVCPHCCMMADAPCECPECSQGKPVKMIPGDPDKIPQYLERQTIFYGAPLD